MQISNRASDKLARFIFPLFVLILVACQGGTSSVVSTATVVPSSPTPTTTPPTNTFWIDSSQDLGQISKFVLGANHGPWSDLGVANLEPAKTSGITFLRWPGGNWGDQNDVQTYQIDYYITQAHLLGAEPSITVRLLNGTPEQAAQLVQYANIEKRYGIKYWSIGNEPDLYIVKDSTWTPQFYAKRWREFATAMKAVDPTIQFYGPEISGFLGDVDSFHPRELLYANSVKLEFTKRDYLTEFLKVNADLVNIVAVHQYAFPISGTQDNPTWAEMRADEAEWDRIVPNLHRIIKETTGNDKPVAVTEFDSNATESVGTETSPDSFYNALWLADVLGRMIRTQPDITAYWLLKNANTGHGLLGGFDIRPTYYVYQLYKQFGDHLLRASSPEQSVSLFAAKREDNTVTAIFVNSGDQAVSKPLRIENGDQLKLVETYLFDVTHKAESITPPTFKNGDAINLPAQSVIMYILK